MPSRRTQCILSSRPGASPGCRGGPVLWGAHRLSSDHWEGLHLLLQMTVLPYIVLSLITGLGNLTYEQVKTLALRVGTLLLISWGLAFVVILLMPLAFPTWISASFFSTSLIEKQEEINLLTLFIPANPFTRCPTILSRRWSSSVWR